MSSKPNRDAVQAAFDLLVPALRRVMVPVIKTEHKDNWWGSGIYYQVSPMSQKDLPFKGTDADLDQLDLANWLDVADRNSKAIPNNLGRKVKAAVMPLKYARNEIAHLGTADLPDSETSQYLSNALVLMEIIDKDSAPKIRELIKARRTETAPLVPPKVDPEPGKAVAKPMPGVTGTKSGVLAWRDVINLRDDVREGKYQQAEFAADLAQVLDGRATTAYTDADEFFDRTFMTEGIRMLLTNAIRRLASGNGDPVVQLKTAFGGGKTHSMLALYHLAKEGPKTADFLGMRDIFAAADVDGDAFPECKVAVLVGTSLDSANSWQSRGKEKITVHTLWGELAAQLAGTEGYNLVRAQDTTGVAPGSQSLIRLFDLAGPSVILIDELVAYARNLHGQEALSGGTFDSITYFLQALTEAVKACPHVLLVVSIPESDAEMGGDAGRRARDEIELVLGRTEAVWKQANAEEGFEIVRRRMFKDISDPEAMEQTIRAFTRMYGDNGANFPNEAREARYRDRMRAAYPIHPELFDQLYGSWSLLERFQRTRGVLRLMAHILHALYEANDQSPLVMPGSIALDKPQVREEFTRYLSHNQNWDPIIDQDIDGPTSTPVQIEQNIPTLHNMQAARRVARTVFLGSAPGQERDGHRGLTASKIKLGVAVPKDVLGHFDSAISRLAAESRYLYASEDRYWYDTRPNLNRTAADRATQLEDYQVAERITNDLRNLTRSRGPFRAIHVTGSGVDVSDEDAVRLVVLPAAAGYKRQQGENAEAVKLAKAILEHRGTAPRVNKNMIVFLAADADLTGNLNQSVRKALAWQSIVSDGETGKLNLDSYGRVTANAQLKESTESLPARIEEAYKWVLIPEQKDGTGPWSIRAESRNGGSGDSLAAKVFRKLESDGTIITGWSPINLNLELEKWFFKDAPSVTTARVWEMLARYGYSARLNDRDVLIRTIADGAKSGDYFGYADGVQDGGRFLGLKFGDPASVVLDGQSVVVRPDAAREQIERDRQPVIIDGGDGDEDGEDLPDKPKPPIIDPPLPPERIYRTFHGSATVNPNRMIPDFSELVQDVIQHLSVAPGTSVRVRVEIEAENPAGFDERTRRTVSENAVQMKFNHQGFDS